MELIYIVNFLKNKHVIVAMIVTPILALGAYFATDYIVSEKPKVAKTGASYKLAAKSNCRYQSGVCTLMNGDVRVIVKAQRLNANIIKLDFLSELAVQAVLVSSVTDTTESAPLSLQKEQGTEGDFYSGKVTIDNPAGTVLRFALHIAGSNYYAETSAVFVDYGTSFSQENFLKENEE